MHSKQHQPPAHIASSVLREHAGQLQNCFAVGMEDLLGEQNPVWAAVTLDLALVGVKLDAPQPAIFQKRSCGALQQGKDLIMKSGRVAVDAQAQVPVGITVADEEPTVRRCRTYQLIEDRLHHVAQGVIYRRRSRVELNVKPLRAGRKRAANGPTSSGISERRSNNRAACRVPRAAASSLARRPGAPQDNAELGCQACHRFSKTCSLHTKAPAPGRPDTTRRETFGLLFYAPFAARMRQEFTNFRQMAKKGQKLR